MIFSVLILVLVFRPRGLLATARCREGEWWRRGWGSSALPAILIVIAFLFPPINAFLDPRWILNLVYPAMCVVVYIMLALGLNIVVGFAGLLDLGFVAFYALGAYVVGWLASSTSGRSASRSARPPPSPAGTPGHTYRSG